MSSLDHQRLCLMFNHQVLLSTPKQQSSYQQEKSLSHFKNTIKSSLPKRMRLSSRGEVILYLSLGTSI
ncbi:hypothetical protein H4Q26_016291 [Puccinia striiformis f. sp. tritici PST-130]|nr:hypothetical protein H4Q26_016291 [Puccinia striiformis f. sp. tritici PST-130]